MSVEDSSRYPTDSLASVLSEANSHVSVADDLHSIRRHEVEYAPQDHYQSLAFSHLIG